MGSLSRRLSLLKFLLGWMPNFEESNEEPQYASQGHHLDGYGMAWGWLGLWQFDGGCNMDNNVI